MTDTGVVAARAAHESTLRAAADELGLELPTGQFDALLRFNELLQRWNSVYNLTSVRDASAALTLHVIDCLAAVPSLRRHLALPLKAALLDVGSGGGLPGVIFAITHPSVQVTCVDAVGKKTAFVTQVAGELRLQNLTSLHSRIEDVSGSFALIASRAFSSLTDLTRLTGHLLSAHGVWVAMKGKTPAEEIAELPGDVAVFHVEQLRVPALNADRCLVWMRPSIPDQPG